MFLKKKLVEPGFDIIFCDPPYDKLGNLGTLDRVLDALGEGGMLRPNGLLVMEQDVVEGLGTHAAWRLVDDRVYGQSRLRFFQRLEPRADNQQG